jgi:aryl-alcohol dehydrogenase-like predicted oxidoreductase
MVATKIPPLPGHWPPLPHDACEARYPNEYLIRAVDASLKRLKTEVIDLLQLHTWTRAWNQDPNCLDALQQLRKEGKIRFIGISTPEQDQNSLIRLMERGLLDTVQVIYNIFDQEAAAQFLDIALEHNVGVIVRCALDEGSLTGKFSENTTFGKGDWRKNYFRGERLKETLKHVKKVQKTVAEYPASGSCHLASVAVRFALKHRAVGTVITGIRNISQAEINCAISDEPVLADKLCVALRQHQAAVFLVKLMIFYKKGRFSGPLLFFMQYGYRPEDLLVFLIGSTVFEINRISPFPFTLFNVRL